MNRYDFLVDVSNRNFCEIKFNEKMKNHTSFKIGGNCDVFVKVGSVRALIEIIESLRLHKMEFRIIGNGSNLLISDKGLSCVVIKLCKEFSELQLINENEIIAGSAAKLSELCNFALKNSLSGLEFAYGIPGSVGGAIYMNAGAYGGEMKDVVHASYHLDENSEIKEIFNPDLGFSYRNSRYSSSNDVITKVHFKLKKADSNEIYAKMHDFLQKRKNKQPLEYPSAGSTFKRPNGYFAAALIEECGLKGKSIGQAQVSKKHCGFIINKGGATCEEVTKLIKYVQNCVREKKGIMLSTEVKIWK